MAAVSASRRWPPARVQNDGQACKHGLTIAIPDKKMHTLHSPAFGGGQKAKNKVGGVEKRRVEHDATHPSLAFRRDTTKMLERTAKQDHGSVHADLHLTQSKHRIRQVGAGRTLFEASTSMFATASSRGFDPTATAFDLTRTPDPKAPENSGSFTAVKTTGGQSQGTRLAQSLTRYLKDTGKAK